MANLHKNKEYYSNSHWTVGTVQDEMDKGLNLLKDLNNGIITFFGSHRINDTHPNYTHCKNIAYELGKKGYSIISGGGPGIMHAANSGAIQAKTNSIGLKASLLKGEIVNDPIFTHELSFHFLFARRFIMSIKSDALIFYPGGFGTLNELFEYVVLMQTGIVDKVPVICVNKNYWQGLFNWLKDNPLKKDFFIHGIEDLNLISFVDDIKEILEIIK